MKYIKQFGKIFESKEDQIEEIKEFAKDCLTSLSDQNLVYMTSDKEEMTYQHSKVNIDFLIAIYHGQNYYLKNEKLEEIEDSTDLNYVLKTLKEFHEWKLEVLEEVSVAYKRLKEEFPSLEFGTRYDEEEIQILIFFKKSESSNLWTRRGNLITFKKQGLRKYFGVDKMKFSIWSGTSGDEDCLRCEFPDQESYENNLGGIIKSKDGKMDVVHMSSWNASKTELIKESPKIDGEDIFVGVDVLSTQYGSEYTSYGRGGETRGRSWFVGFKLNPKFDFSI